jgi:peptidoglycan/LPS O-acetylase OafA/YrhL
METARLRYRPHLDGLRGVAVIAVLCFHAFPRAVPGGFVGVDIFFVISGYLISSILFADFRAPASPKGGVILNFYGRRVRRIFPSLLVVLLAAYGLGYVLLLPGELEKLSLDIVASAGFCLNFVLAGREGYFAGASGSNPLLHLWSLGVEEQFYLFWPLVVWLLLRCRIKMLPVVVFLAAFSFCWNAQKYAADAAAAFYLPQMRLWELLLGAIAAILFPLAAPAPAGSPANPASGWVRRLGGRLFANVLPALGLGLIAAGLAVIKIDTGAPDRWTLLPTVGAVCVIGSADTAWINRRILAHRLLVWVGLISYPLYLWHWTLLAFAQISSARPDAPLFKIAVLAVSVLLAWLTYRLVEGPLRHGRHLGRKTAALAGAMIAVACLGAYSRRAQGFPSRFPHLISAISTYHYDAAAAVREGTYFLIGNQDETMFPKDPNEIRPGKPTLYLWGDSYAAALYPGLHAVYGQQLNVVQRTAAQTPPFLPEYFNPGNARRINRFVLESIVRDRPDYVVLAAVWQNYDWPKVEGTLVALKAAEIHHIVLVGPAPEWIGSLRQQLFNYVRTHRNEPVPVRLRTGFDPAPALVDQQMAALAGRLGVEYISLIRILTSPAGTLVRTGDTPDSLTTYDSGHLSISASKYVVERFPRL